MRLVAMILVDVHVELGAVDDVVLGAQVEDDGATGADD